MKNKSKFIIIMIIGIITICTIILSFKSIGLNQRKTELEEEVDRLKSTMEEQNKKLTSQSNENKKLEEELATYKGATEDENDKLIEENIEILSLHKQSEYLKSALRINEYSNNKVEFFPLYHTTGKNIDGYTEEEGIGGYILVDKNLSIKEKMQLIANNVSRSYFGLPIEVEKIEDREGKKFAVINLVEYTEDEWDEWSKNFQGTTRETFTISTLERNFIQEQYYGNWIDGIEIQQNHGIRKAGHIGDIDWIVYRDDNIKKSKKYKLQEFLHSEDDKDKFQIVGNKIISKDGSILIQEPVKRGNQWTYSNMLTVITRVDFSYYDGNTFSGENIETLTLDLRDGTILKRYIGKGKGLIKEELLYPDSLFKN